MGGAPARCTDDSAPRRTRIGSFAGSGSFAPVRSAVDHFRSSADNGHQPTGPVCPFRPNKRHRNASLDHLIGTAEQRLGNRKAEHPGRLEIDDHLHFRSLLNRQVGRLLALENPAGVDAD